MKGLSLLVVSTVLGLTALAGASVSAQAAGVKVPALYKNCTNLNKKYPHGVGRAKARDKTSGERVTNFKRAPCSITGRCPTTRDSTATKTASPARRLRPLGAVLLGHLVRRYDGSGHGSSLCTIPRSMASPSSAASAADVEYVRKRPTDVCPVPRSRAACAMCVMGAGRFGASSTTSK